MVDMSALVLNAFIALRPRKRYAPVVTSKGRLHFHYEYMKSAMRFCSCIYLHKAKPQAYNRQHFLCDTLHNQ